MVTPSNRPFAVAINAILLLLLLLLLLIKTYKEKTEIETTEK